MDISDFIGAAKTFHVLGIKVTKDGDLINEWYSEPECRRNIYSATKSFTSCAVGFAVQEGLLSLDEKLTDAFPEDLPDVIDDNLEMATVRDLLTMCLGQEQGSLMGEQRPLYQEDDWVKMSLAIPFQYKPGTHFVYNNVGPYLAGILIQRRAGCDLVSYLTPRLFSHIGIKRPTWETDPLGNSFGAGGLFPIRIRLSLLLPNAVKVKNLCVHYMILCVQNYKLTFIGKQYPRHFYKGKE